MLATVRSSVLMIPARGASTASEYGMPSSGVPYWEDEISGDARILIATLDLLLVAIGSSSARDAAELVALALS